MTKLTKFTPIVVLETFEGDLYFTESSIEQVADILNNMKFVMLNGEGIACSSIKSFRKDVCGIQGLERYQIKELMAWKKKYMEEKLVAPDETLMIKKINRIKNGEKLT